MADAAGLLIPLPIDSRPVSRGRPAGKRKSLRFLNDNLIPARSLWGLSAFSPDEVADRLAHIAISVDHHTLFEPLLNDSSNRELLAAFRRGELAAPDPGVPHRKKKQSARVLLEVMAGRVDRRVRKLLLQHARSDAGFAFVQSCERALHFVLQGTVPDADLHASIFDATSAEHVLLRPAVWYASAALPCIDAGPVDDESSPDGCRSGGVTLLLAFSDGFHRLLVQGLAVFYGCESKEWEEESTGETARCLKVWLTDKDGVFDRYLAVSKLLQRLAPVVPPGASEGPAALTMVEGARSGIDETAGAIDGSSGQTVGADTRTMFVPLFLAFSHIEKLQRSSAPIRTRAPGATGE
jgi:hypothetical protein